MPWIVDLSSAFIVYGWLLLLGLGGLLLIHCWGRAEPSVPWPASGGARSRRNRWFWTVALLVANPFLLAAYLVQVVGGRLQGPLYRHLPPILLGVQLIALAGLWWMQRSPIEEARTYSSGDGQPGDPGFELQAIDARHVCRSSSDRSISRNIGPELMPAEIIALRLGGDDAMTQAIGEHLAEALVANDVVRKVHYHPAGDLPEDARIDLFCELVSGIDHHRLPVGSIRLEGPVGMRLRTPSHPDLVRLVLSHQLDYEGTISGVSVGRPLHDQAAIYIADQLCEAIRASIEDGQEDASFTGRLPPELFPPSTLRELPRELTALLPEAPVSVMASRGYALASHLQLRLPMVALLPTSEERSSSSMDRVPELRNLIAGLQNQGWTTVGSGWSAPASFTGSLRRGDEWLSYEVEPPLGSVARRYGPTRSPTLSIRSRLLRDKIDDQGGQAERPTEPEQLRFELSYSRLLPSGRLQRIVDELLADPVRRPPMFVLLPLISHLPDEHVLELAGRMTVRRLPSAETVIAILKRLPQDGTDVAVRGHLLDLLHLAVLLPGATVPDDERRAELAEDLGADLSGLGEVPDLQTIEELGIPWLAPAEPGSVAAHARGPDDDRLSLRTELAIGETAWFVVPDAERPLLGTIGVEPGTDQDGEAAFTVRFGVNLGPRGSGWSMSLTEPMGTKHPARASMNQWTTTVMPIAGTERFTAAVSRSAL